MRLTRRHKNLAQGVAALALVIFSAPILAMEPLEPASRMIEQGEYKEALEHLTRKIRDPLTSMETRADLMLALARFYDTHAGDLNQARAWLNRILTDPGISSPAREQARKDLRELDRLSREHKDLEQLLHQTRSLVLQPGPSPAGPDKDLLRAKMTALESAVKLVPDFYRIHEIYYVLGLAYLKTGRPRPADRFFSKALARKPALFLSLPVSRFQASARDQWIRDLGQACALTVSGCLLLLLAPGFVFSRPWQWLGFSHLGVGILMGLCWILVFWTGAHVLGRLEKPGEIINRDTFYPPPAYVDYRPGSPGAKPVRVLFGYGSAALAGIYFFCIFTSRMKNRGLVLAFNSAFGLAAAGSVLTLFYFHHLDVYSRYYARPEPFGYFAFRVSEPEPYLLTNPRAYPVIELDSINDPELVKWLKRYQ